MFSRIKKDGSRFLAARTRVKKGERTIALARSNVQGERICFGPRRGESTKGKRSERLIKGDKRCWERTLRKLQMIKHKGCFLHLPCFEIQMMLLGCLVTGEQRRLCQSQSMPTPKISPKIFREFLPGKPTIHVLKKSDTTNHQEGHDRDGYKDFKKSEASFKSVVDRRLH